MRTTVDLPDELHQAAVSIARDRGRSLSQTLSDLVRKGLTSGTGAGSVSIDPKTGFPLIYVGHPLTTEMVRAADEEE